MLKNITLPIILSFLGLLVSTFVLVFGNNIFQRFQRAELVYSTQQMELKLPSNFVIQAKKGSADFIPNFFREVKIKNVGGMPSTKLKVAISLDGNAYDVQTSCIENITNVKNLGTSIEISLDRLVKNAEINCKIWMIQKPGKFSITSIDDQGINEVNIDKQEGKMDWLKIISILVIGLILSFLVHKYYVQPIIDKNSVLTEQNIELQSQTDFLSNQLDDLKHKSEEHDTGVDIITELENLMAKHNKAKD